MLRAAPQVPSGAVRDIVAKALGSRVPFWRRMDYEVGGWGFVVGGYSVVGRRMVHWEVSGRHVRLCRVVCGGPQFKQMQKQREAVEEARRLRRERLGLKRRGGDGEEDEKAKSKYWNNFWVSPSKTRRTSAVCRKRPVCQNAMPGCSRFCFCALQARACPSSRLRECSGRSRGRGPLQVPGSLRNASAHKHFKRGSENQELLQYRSFNKDKQRLSRWFLKCGPAPHSTAPPTTASHLPTPAASLPAYPARRT